MATVQKLYKNYINGYTNPRFIIVTGNPLFTFIDLKAKPGAILETVAETYLIDTIIDGHDELEFLWTHYYWTLDFKNFIQSPELLKFRDIMNYQQKKYTILFQPEVESGRLFIVYRVPDPVTIGRMPFKQGHTGFTATIKTQFPLTLQTTPGGTIWWLPVSTNGSPVSSGHTFSFLASEGENIFGDEDTLIIV
jgi:hypothetical protein